MADLQIPAAFTDDQLADLAKAEALVLWHKHRKLEMIAGGIAAPVSAFLVGATVYLFGSASAGIPYSAIAGAIAAAILGTAITLAFIYGYYRFIEAPSNLYFKTYRQMVDVQQVLADEQAKNAEPNLVGQINCLGQEACWNVASYTESEGMLLDVYLVIDVTLSNEGAPTTVRKFNLKLIRAGVNYDATTLPIEDYCVTRTLPPPIGVNDGFGLEKWKEPLTSFPYDSEVTNTNHKSGWLRFFVRGVPPKAGNEPIIHEDISLELSAIDRKGRPHKIYEGAWNLPPCGAIERMPVKWERLSPRTGG
ncbi:MAG: hypothetical protein QOE96_3820 [Blastocatellia bacterium]|jgi:hypothetical protein|nr:hypothetical protein [Blastocatellia bacterium]